MSQTNTLDKHVSAFGNSKPLTRFEALLKTMQACAYLPIFIKRSGLKPVGSGITSLPLRITTP